MPDFPTDEQETFADALAEVRREFREGLPERLILIESALGVLDGGFDLAAAELVHQQSHSLKGTAGAFGADGLAGPAREISAIAGRWVDRREATVEQLSDVRRELHRLGQAVNHYLSS